MLVVTSVITGLLALFGLLAVTTAPSPLDLSVIFLFVIFVVLFTVPVAATVGVARRARWARVFAIIAGISVSLTCLGLGSASRSSSLPLVHRSTVEPRRLADLKSENLAGTEPLGDC
jgi:hypothetical protein